MDEVRIPTAGDPFTATSGAAEQDHPHACMDGFVYLGYTAVDEETGEEVERVEALPCRRCAEASEAGASCCARSATVEALVGEPLEEG